MNNTFSEELFLTNETGRMLYHKYAEALPIIDYHCHLQPREILENQVFEDLGEMWLRGDHYKWRCMRTFGIDERYITGDAGYYEKYMRFAEILPQLAGNPIYIWCALELKRYFGIDEPLTAKNAQQIYDKTKAIIGFHVVVVLTDDLTVFPVLIQPLLVAGDFRQFPLLGRDQVVQPL